MDAYLLFALLGLGSGAVYGLLALGVVLEYRSSGFVNFAHGALAMFVAYVFSELRVHGELLLPVVGLPDRISLGGPLGNGPALLISLAYAALLGGLVYVVAFRPLRHAPPLARVVSSIGLLLALQSLVVLKFGTLTRTVTAILPNEPLSLGGVTFPRDRLYLAGVLVVVAAGVWALYRFTRFGLATRAAAENERATTLLGYSPDSLALANWVLATVLAGLAGILVAPMTTLAPATYTLFIVPALGAALLARFSSFAVTAAGGLALGVATSELTKLQTTFDWLPRHGLQSGLPFLLILVVMFTLGKTVPARGTVVGAHIPKVGTPRRPFLAAAVLVPVAAVLLHVLQGGYRLALTQSMVTAIVVLSVVVLTGYVGQISFAQASFAGIGGFTLAKVTTGLGVPFPLSILLAGLAAVPLGVLVGLPALRIRGVNLAVITLAAAIAMDEFLFKYEAFTGGFSGSRVERPNLAGLDLSITGSGAGDFPRAAFGITVACVLAVCAVGVARLRTSGLGRRMLAVRANERAAASLGIDVARTKLAAFAISSFVAAVGGSLMGYQQEILSYESFGVFTSLVFVTVAYVGGIGRISGALLGGAMATGGLVPVLLDRWIGFGEYELLFVGCILIYSAIRHPDGITTGFGGHRRRRSAEAGGETGSVEPALATMPGPARLVAEGRHQ